MSEQDVPLICDANGNPEGFKCQSCGSVGAWIRYNYQKQKWLCDNCNH